VVTDEFEQRVDAAERMARTAQAQAAAAEARAIAAEKREEEMLSLLRVLQQQQQELSDQWKQEQKRTVLRRERESRSDESGDLQVPASASSHESLVDELVDPGGIKRRSINPLVVMTDLGGDLGDAGDLVALFLLRGLEQVGRVSLRGLIVNDSRGNLVERAKDLVQELSFKKCVVGKHSTKWGEGGNEEGNEHDRSAMDVLTGVLEDPDIPEFSLIIVCVCSLSGFAQFIKTHGEAAARKIKHVALLSSVHEFKSDALFRAVQRGDTDTSVCFLRPDQHHPHNQSDLPAAEYAYLRLQQLGVPLIIVSRHAVYQAAVPAYFFDLLAETRRSVAVRVRDEAKRSIEHLWFRVQQTDASMREGLPTRCTEAWFAQTFCNGVIPPGDHSPWDFVKKFSMYDSVTLISAIPELRTKLFSTGAQYEYDCGTASHIVYGHSEKSHGVAQQVALSKLLEDAALAAISADLEKLEPCPIVIYTDPGLDLDDEVTLIALRALVARKLVRPIAIVCNLHPAMHRARLAKGTLKLLGLPDVPVAAGTDGGCRDHEGLVEDVNQGGSPYMADESEIEPDANEMVRNAISKEADESVLVLCISSLTDVNMFLTKNEDLFMSKVHSVTIMGGVETPEPGTEANAAIMLSPTISGSSRSAQKTPSSARGEQKRTEEPPAQSFYLKPDSANNNTFDMAAAEHFYYRLQELAIKTNVLTRFAAYDAPMGRHIYDDMAETGSPIAKRLLHKQRSSIEELWKRANAVGPDRRGLPERCSRSWYCKTFLGGKGLDRRGADSIWDLVQHFNMYDPMALLLAVPFLSWQFYYRIPIGGTR